MMRIQTKRHKKVAKDIFLHRPAPRGGLGKLYHIAGIGGGDTGNQRGPWSAWQVSVPLSNPLATRRISEHPHPFLRLAADKERDGADHE
jgi:hypothetical protein